MTTAIPAEGRVELRIEWDGQAVQRAEVRSRRPQPAALLAGRAPELARAIIPRLYSLCGDAQSVAVEALETVLRNREPDSPRIADWGERIRLENIREHLWRLGLDWPGVAGEPQQPAPVRELLAERTRFATDREGAASWAGRTFVGLFGSSHLAWLEEADQASLAQWLDATPTPLAVLLARLRPRLTGLGPSGLPLFPAGDLHPLVQAALPRLRADPDFHWRPDHQGLVFEMGPLARQVAHPLIASMLARQGVPDSWLRVLARVLELAGALQSLETGVEPLPGIAWQHGDNESVVALDMVRGVLIHWQETGPDGIRDYRIVAPTEWNFHPQGPAREGLLQLRATDEACLREMVTLQVMALDPCVQYELEILHA